MPSTVKSNFHNLSYQFAFGFTRVAALDDGFPKTSPGLRDFDRTFPPGVQNIFQRLPAK